jgi:carbon-monoxide dehydrogenase medium subunit
MHTAPFIYKRARTLAEAQDLLREDNDAKLLAGGQSLLPTMKQRLAAPSMLVDIARIAELNFIRREGDMLVIGAAVCHADVAASPIVREVIPGLASLAGEIGDPAVRYRGTLGGSVANNDPAADYPAALLALDAEILTTRKTIAAADFFTGFFETALEPNDVITAVRFAVPLASGYAKFRNPASRYAIAGVFVARFADHMRVAVTGAASCVFRIEAMEHALEKRFAPDALEGIEVPADDLNTDLHASAEYRAHLVTVMAKRAVRNAQK